jgi:hypothetical protein
MSYRLSYSDPMHWRGRAEEMRALGERMRECVSKHMMFRMAQDYERLARTAEERMKGSSPSLVDKTAVVPAAARQFARRKKPVGAPPAGLFSDLPLPRFLRRGPMSADEMEATVASAHQAIDHDDGRRTREGRGRGAAPVARAG